MRLLVTADPKTDKTSDKIGVTNRLTDWVIHEFSVNDLLLLTYLPIQLELG